MKQGLTIILITLCSVLMCAQEMGYDIRGTWGKPIPKEKLADVETMVDMNPGYPSSWINEEDYISAEIITTHDGKEMIAAGTNDILNIEQKKLIHNAEIGSDIRVEVKYHVQDFLKKKLEVKTLKFELTVVPTIQAEYIGGREALMAYLKDATVDLMPASNEDEVKFAMVKFTIDQNGNVKEPTITESSKDKMIDEVVLKAIQNMPSWTPAQDAIGKFVSQSFEFVIGNSIGC